MKTYKMCTMKAEQEYKHEGLAFDDITVRLKSAVSNKELVLYFLFIFMKGDLILGYGKQKICFLNNKTNRFAKVPVELIDGMKKNIYYYLYQS
ncbi:MAG: hypothetical protein GY830_09615 [Bacteroidetes bacterium]|nr:hypothetical protein [Bacteroidota bacterium]